MRLTYIRLYQLVKEYLEPGPVTDGVLDKLALVYSYTKEMIEQEKKEAQTETAIVKHFAARVLKEILDDFQSSAHQIHDLLKTDIEREVLDDLWKEVVIEDFESHLDAKRRLWKAAKSILEDLQEEAKEFAESEDVDYSDMYFFIEKIAYLDIENLALDEEEEKEYSPFVRASEYQKVSEEDLAYLKGEPAPLKIGLKIDIEK